MVSESKSVATHTKAPRSLAEAARLENSRMAPEDPGYESRIPKYS